MITLQLGSGQYRNARVCGVTEGIRAFVMWCLTYLFFPIKKLQLNRNYRVRRVRFVVRYIPLLYVL